MRCGFTRDGPTEVNSRREKSALLFCGSHGILATQPTLGLPANQPCVIKPQSLASERVHMTILIKKGRMSLLCSTGLPSVESDAQEPLVKMVSLVLRLDAVLAPCLGFSRLPNS